MHTYDRNGLLIITIVFIILLPKFSTNDDFWVYYEENLHFSYLILTRKVQASLLREH